MEWKFAERLEWTCCCCFRSKLENWESLHSGGELVRNAQTAHQANASGAKTYSIWCTTANFTLWWCTRKQATKRLWCKTHGIRRQINASCAPKINARCVPTRQILLHQERNSFLNWSCCFIKAKLFTARLQKSASLYDVCTVAFYGSKPKPLFPLHYFKGYHWCQLKWFWHGKCLP